MPSKPKPEVVRRTTFTENAVLEPILNKLLIAPYDKEQTPYTEDEYEEEGVIYTFPKDNAVLRQKVKLPLQVIEPDGNNLLDDVENYIKKYVDLSEREYAACAAYIIMSYCYTVFETIPYLRFRGDLGTGKSRAMDVIGTLCYKAIDIEGGLTAPVLFRLSDLYGGTMVLDEADFAQSDERADIVKALNAGNKDGGTVSRCNPINPNEIDFFDIFCPKVLASRKGWSDAALESRCFAIQMMETTRDDIQLFLQSGFKHDQDILREQLTWWRVRLYSRLIKEFNENDFSEQLKNVDKRTGQVSLPLLFVEKIFQKDTIACNLKEFAEETFESRRSSPEGLIANAMVDLVTIGELPFKASTIQGWLKKEHGISEKDYSVQRIGRITQGMGILKDRTNRARFFDVETPAGIKTFKKAVKRYVTSDELVTALDTLNQNKLDV